MKAKLFWEFASGELSAGRRLELMLVIESHGSSPGRQGFKMALSENGEMRGTIGGGVMEFKLLRLARERLEREAAPPPEIHKQIHDNTAPADRSGMICAGEQTVAMLSLQAGDAAAVQSIAASCGLWPGGKFRATANGIGFEEVMTVPESPIFAAINPDDWFYQEHVGIGDAVYIVGGGHVGAALSDVMSRLGFYVEVFDHRPDVETFAGISSADRKTVSDYHDLCELIRSGERCFVAIVSTNFKTDEAALRSLLKGEYRYLGVMGSEAKIAAIKETMRKEGVPEAKLEALRAPIGLPIHSQTPEEIAISIAAEIINVKNEPKKKRGRPKGGRSARS